MPWFQQRAGISVAGEGADSHDDFKPVQKDSSAAPSVTEHIEQVFYLLYNLSVKTFLLESL